MKSRMIKNAERKVTAQSHTLRVVQGRVVMKWSLLYLAEPEHLLESPQGTIIFPPDPSPSTSSTPSGLSSPFPHPKMLPHTWKGYSLPSTSAVCASSADWYYPLHQCLVSLASKKVKDNTCSMITTSEGAGALVMLQFRSEP